METNQRYMRTQTDDMPPNPESAFSLPAAKDKISARVDALTKKKLTAIMAIWKAHALVEKRAEMALMDATAKEKEEMVNAAVADVNLTYTIESLLKRACDVELAQWGGYPDSPEKLAAVVRAIEKSAK